MRRYLISFFVAKKLLALALIVSMLVPALPAHSQAQPVANFVINRTVAGVLGRVAASRGFAANDPRIAATLAGVGSSMSAVNTASTVAGVAFAVAGAPVWMSVVAGLGVLAAGAAIVAGASKLELSSGGLKYTPPLPVEPAYAGGSWTPAQQNILLLLPHYVASGAKIFRAPGCFISDPCGAFPEMPDNFEYYIKILLPSQKRLVYGSSDVTGPTFVVFSSLAEFQEKFVYYPNYSASGANSTYVHRVGTTLENWSYPGVGTTQNMVWASPPTVETAADGSKRVVGDIQVTITNYYSDGTVSGVTYVDAFKSDSAWFTGTLPASKEWASKLIVSSVSQPYTVTKLDDLHQQLTAEQRAAQLDPQTIARIVSKAWEEAASKPGYEGMPYSLTDPVTSEEVAQWTATNQTPTVGDLLTPASNPDSSSVPVAPNAYPVGSGSPGTGAGTNDVNVVNTPNVNVVNDLKVDLGENPGVPSPGLEGTPTASSILAPILGLLPDFRSYVLPVNFGECPRPTLDVDMLNVHTTIGGHCDLAEQVRSELRAGMLVFFTVASAMIVLGA